MHLSDVEQHDDRNDDMSAGTSKSNSVLDITTRLPVHRAIRALGSVASSDQHCDHWQNISALGERSDDEASNGSDVLDGRLSTRSRSPADKNNRETSIENRMTRSHARGRKSPITSEKAGHEETVEGSPVSQVRHDSSRCYIDVLTCICVFRQHRRRPRKVPTFRQKNAATVKRRKSSVAPSRKRAQRSAYLAARARSEAAPFASRQWKI